MRRRRYFVATIWFVLGVLAATGGPSTFLGRVAVRCATCWFVALFFLCIVFFLSTEDHWILLKWLHRCLGDVALLRRFVGPTFEVRRLG